MWSLAVASCGGTEQQITTGSERGRCYPNGTCNGGLTCASDVCVRLEMQACATANGGCSSHATCTNTAGSRTCSCNSGWTGDGLACADIDECATANGGCSSHATCTNNAGDHSCSCKSGWTGDGFTCVSEELVGTFVHEYGITYDRIEVLRQESANGYPQAMIVSYIKETAGVKEWPIKIVAKWPINAGQAVDLTTHGSITHFTVGGESFPVLEQGSITFDKLGGADEQASGKFFATFKGGGTLNGSFAGNVNYIVL